MSLSIIIPLGLWVIALSLTLWGTWYSLSQIRRPLPRVDGWVPLSILKPLKGLDAGIEDNLRSFFHLDYPTYELLFSIAENSDPAGEVVRRLMREHPDVPARLITGSIELGPNPKVNNMVRSYRQAKYDYLLISDSNVRVRPDYLRELVAHLNPQVGVVTAVVAGQNAGGLGGLLEATYLNSFYARWMHIAFAFGVSFVVGKSMLFRRSTAERFGGIENLARYIAEDYMAGQAVRRLGLKVVAMSRPIDQYIGRYAVRTFWQRHLRWGRIRKAQAPLAFSFEPLLGSLVSGFLGAWALHRLLGVAWPFVMAVHCAIWLLCDLVMIHAVESRVRWQVLPTWVLRECLAFPLWVQTACGNTIQWRGNRLRIHSGGLLAPVRGGG
jgi:ceramide glucosyltransferase